MATRLLGKQIAQVCYIFRRFRHFGDALLASRSLKPLFLGAVAHWMATTKSNLNQTDLVLRNWNFLFFFFSFLYFYSIRIEWNKSTIQRNISLYTACVYNQEIMSWSCHSFDLSEKCSYASLSPCYSTLLNIKVYSVIGFPLPPTFPMTRQASRRKLVYFLDDRTHFPTLEGYYTVARYVQIQCTSPTLIQVNLVASICCTRRLNR